MLQAVSRTILLLLALCTMSVSAAWGGEAVILMYHRFGEAGSPSTNIQVDQFESHLEELKSGGYAILPLADIVAAFAEGKLLPERAVAITIDDAYASVYREAWPRLQAAHIPFTLFVSTDAHDQRLPGYMSWDQIRELRDAGVTIGHHGASHASLLKLPLEEAKADIAKASERFTAELGAVPALFAYPYGEYDVAVRDYVKSQGFKAALAQYSGVAGDGFLYELPRFAINESYAGLGRFRLIVNARALPVAELVPADPRVKDNPPAFGFSLTENVPGLKALACYPSHLDGPADITFLGEARIEVRFEKPFPRGRSRINCTMPGPGKRWYWFGRPFFVN